ncbi:MAG: antibiotic biosynthesis monooxygenase, partial [Gammaproteobacteria bacterium]
MDRIADTPKAPYYAVIFTSLKSGDAEGYADTAERMLELA